MNIAIIGCGYLGTEAARVWTREGHHVTATTRTPEKLASLAEAAQKTVILREKDTDTLALLIASNDVLVVTVAADDRSHYEEAYLKTALSFRSLALEMNQPRRLLYTSSTSVYGDAQGQWVDELSPLKEDTETCRILAETERVYLSLQELGWSVVVFRLAEIYGPERSLQQKVLSFLGKQLPGDGSQYANMIHRDDAVRALDYALKHPIEGIYNLADDEHPTRKELYDRVSKKGKLPLAHWDPSLSGLRGGSKRVSNHKIKAEGFILNHPSRDL